MSLRKCKRSLDTVPRTSREADTKLEMKNVEETTFGNFKEPFQKRHGIALCISHDFENSINNSQLHQQPSFSGSCKFEPDSRTVRGSCGYRFRLL